MTQFDFIFMLTRNDRTVADAAVHAETALRAGIRHIGFKDIGLPFDALARLARQIRAGGASTYLEVVSLDRDSEIRSVKAAIELGVDYLLGGTHAQDVLPLLKGRPFATIRFRAALSGTRAPSKDRRPRSSKAPSRSSAIPASPVSTSSPTARQATCHL
jgi:DNA-binding NarL/FixJ family response regulator